MTEAQKPAIGISEDAQYPGTKSFTVQCQCTDPRCAVTTYIEVISDTEIASISVIHHASAVSPLPRASRWRAIWELIRHGHTDYQHDFMLSKQAAINWISAVQGAIDELEKEKK